MANYNISVDVIGAKDLTDAINGVSRVAQQAIMRAVDKTAYQIQSRAMENAPHKTGALRNSIHVEPAQVTKDNIEARVGTNIAYGAAQEFGTQGMTIHSRSKTGKPFTYVGNIKPKLYMKRAKTDSGPDFVDNMKEALGSIVRHLAAG